MRKLKEDIKPKGFYEALDQSAALRCIISHLNLPVNMRNKLMERKKTKPLSWNRRFFLERSKEFREHPLIGITGVMLFVVPKDMFTFQRPIAMLGNYFKCKRASQKKVRYKHTNGIS